MAPREAGVEPLGGQEELNLSLEHLQAELARLEVRIRREVRRWQLAGQDPADAYRGLYVSDAQAEALLARPVATSWGQTIDLPPAEAQAFAEAEAEATRHAQALAAAARQPGKQVRFRQLTAAFGLEPFEADALLVCLAPSLDSRYEQLYSYLQDDVTRKSPTVNLVLDLLAQPGLDRLSLLRHFRDDAPLFRYRLLERVPESRPGRQSLLGQALHPDETIVAWLLGSYEPPAELGASAIVDRPQESETDRLLAAPVWPDLARAAAGRPIIIFQGPDDISQAAAARRLAAHLRRPLLTVDLAGVVAADLPPLPAIRLALRDARLTGALPCLTGWDACIAAGAPLPGLLAEMYSYPDLCIVAGRAPWQPAGIARHRHLLRLDFPIPAYAERLALWRHFLAPSAIDVEPDLAALAGQFLLTAGQIRDAVASAGDEAAQRGRQLENRDLFAAARAHSNPGLAVLAHKIVPRYGWDDIVLPADQLALLREIIATVRGRPLVLDTWGVGRKLAPSAGVTILFAGSPGTGKTMAAEIIAAELGLDLYKIDLSTIVSKYIGETEKNLERIFVEAAASNAILFFDEADALFGKRSEVRDSHDRYANIEISYLLQRMEAYEGVTILATNLRANLDEAFTRRLQFAVDFPFPEEADRLRIWHALMPPDLPRAADLDLALLARRFKLAGGNIRNIIVGAAYLAGADGQAVTMSHLLHSTRRELQKMGRLVGEQDLIAS